MPSNPMVRSNSARLAYWYACRSLGSKLVNDSSITLNKALHQRNAREFGSDICNSSRFLGKSENGNQRNGVWFGVSHYGLDFGLEEIVSWDGDHYEILEVCRNASVSEIKKAYYELEKKLQPAMNKGEANAERNFQKVLKAYEVLKNEENRLMYDQVKRLEAEGVPSEVAEEIFKAIKNSVKIVDASFQSKEESISELNRGVEEICNDLWKLGIERGKYVEENRVVLQEIVKRRSELMSAKRSQQPEDENFDFIKLVISFFLSISGAAIVTVRMHK